MEVRFNYLSGDYDQVPVKEIQRLNGELKPEKTILTREDILSDRIKTERQESRIIYIVEQDSTKCIFLWLVETIEFFEDKQES